MIQDQTLASAPAGTRKERRREPRPPVTLSWMLQRNRIALDEAGIEKHACKILDASDNGFRVVLNPPRQVSLGELCVIEHPDGWRRQVCVRWASKNQLGLEIIGDKTFVILGPAPENVHPCDILATTEQGYRITLTPARPLKSEFTLELANGSRKKVRATWAFDGEYGLVLVEPPGRARR